jgi:CDP-diacylglycerol--serine O-phosphatidyltransferase
MAAVPGVRFLPNAITVLALCSGLTSVAFALRGEWLPAVGALGLAGIFDSLDGPAARLLRSTSRIGAELDSLSDCVSFGMAPALIIYIWLLEQTAIGWAACLVFAVCAALRLARFNSLLDDTPRPWAKGFFTGVPTPAGGLLAVVPLLLTLRLGDGPWSNVWVVGAWIILLGLLMVSRVPSIALKSVRMPQALILPMLVLMVVAVAALVYEPELVFCIGLGVYLLHLPYAGWKFQHVKRHPELWADRSGIRRPRGRRVRLAVRMPRRKRVAGRGPDGTPLPPQRRRGAATMSRLSRRRLR